MKRFLDKIIKIKDCWIWQAGKLKSGYGKFRYRGKDWYAHRVAYTLYKGEIPKGLFVLHSCDNPSCVNPEHLSVGTQMDNLRDMRSKGKSMNTSSKLTEEQVKYIRDTNFDRRLYKSLFGISMSTISVIKNKRTWREV